MGFKTIYNNLFLLYYFLNSLLRVQTLVTFHYPGSLSPQADFLWISE